MIEPVYIGELESIELEDGTELEAHATLGIIPGIGLVTAESREDLAAGYYLRGRGPREQLARVYYYRRRPEGDQWYHDTPGATCVIQGEQIAIHAANAVRCNRPGDFICTITTH